MCWITCYTVLERNISPPCLPSCVTSMNNGWPIWLNCSGWLVEQSNTVHSDSGGCICLGSTVKNKTGIAVTQAMQTILKRTGHTPQKLRMDASKDLYNWTLWTLIKRCNIRHFTYWRVIQSHLERETVSVLEGKRHAVILTGLAEYRTGL